MMSIAFVLGLLIQSILLTGKSYFKIILYIFLGCVIFVAIIGSIDSFESSDYFKVITLFYSIFFGFLFRKIILKSINKIILIIWNLLFIYLYFDSIKENYLLLILILVVTLVIIVNGFTNKQPEKFLKVFQYFCFLCLLIAVALKNFSFDQLNLIVQSTPSLYNISEAIFYGMAFLYIAIHGWVLFGLFPDNKGLWKEEADVLASKFSEYQSQPILILMILVFFLIISTIKIKFNYLNEPLLINTVLILTSVYQLQLFPKDTINHQPKTGFERIDSKI